MAVRSANSPPQLDDARAASVERFLAGAPRSHFMQSREWLDVFKDDREAIEQVVTEGDDGSVCCYSGVRRVQGRAWLGEKCFIDGGPVFSSEAQLERHLADLLAVTGNASLIRVRPYLAEREGARLRELLGDHAFHMLPPQQQSGYATTLVLDLTRSLDSLHAEFSTNLRRSLKRATRSGISVERIVEGSAFGEFASMLSRAAVVAGYDVPPPDRVQRYLAAVCQPQAALGALFCARDTTGMQAGIAVLRAGASLVYQWGARAKPEEHSDAPLAHALHWEAIKWGRAQSFERYDFGGLTDGPEPNGIDRFKQAFGGERQRMFGEALRARGLWGHVFRLRAVASRNRAKAVGHA